MNDEKSCDRVYPPTVEFGNVPEFSPLSFGNAPDFGPIQFSESPKKGLIVFHVNVGQLPTFKAEAFIDRLKESHRESLEGTRKVCDVIYIPTRTQETRVEYIPFQ